MTDISVLEVDREIEKATKNLAESIDNINLIQVSPPQQCEGIDAAPDLLEALHLLEIQSKGFLFKTNKSPVCGMELWYENNKTQFVFYTPEREIEKQYRQQISGYYTGCEIAKRTKTEGKFIQAEEGDAIAITRLQLKDHYFKPVASPDGDDNEISGDPYKRLLNQVDTKDNTRFMMQVLYKPAPHSWTDLQHMNLETYSSRIRKKGGVKTRYFGLKVDEVDDPGIYESAASEIQNRIGKSAFFVNIRLAVITSDDKTMNAKEKAESRMNSILNTIDHLYETKVDQKFVPKCFKANRTRNEREVLTNMIERNHVYMEQPKELHKFLWHKLTPNQDVIIMTKDELAGLVHLPSVDEVSTKSINWEHKPVEGSAPPDVDDFEPVPVEELDELNEDKYEIYDEEDELQG